MQSLRFLPVVAVLLPLAEIYTALQVASAVGVVATLGLLVLGGVLGSLLVRRQGLGVLLRLRQSLERGGEAPTAAVVEGALVVVAGLLLVLPGLLTDAVALLLLVPPVRRLLVGRWMKGRPPGVVAPPGQRVIEGEWRRER
ncbi:MAG: FxsA family protein [Gammaproteobacteria bacterium]|jgi:UPF0716 protein FxsA|nr:FxsA family protein [Gammaproteobacteria bacterium]